MRSCGTEDCLVSLGVFFFVSWDSLTREHGLWGTLFYLVWRVFESISIHYLPDCGINMLVPAPCDMNILQDTAMLLRMARGQEYAIPQVLRLEQAWTSKTLSNPLN